MESADRQKVYLTKAGDNSLQSGTMIVAQTNMQSGTTASFQNDSHNIEILIKIPECGEMKSAGSHMASNQTKWCNAQNKNFIINTVPVKNEVIYL